MASLPRTLTLQPPGYRRAPRRFKPYSRSFRVGETVRQWWGRVVAKVGKPANRQEVEGEAPGADALSAPCLSHPMETTGRAILPSSVEWLVVQMSSLLRSEVAGKGGT
jgi:hypothetical protein